MINPAEFRLGNYVLYKSGGRIAMTALSYHHFDVLSKGDVADFFPVVLKPELFVKCGFIENMDYPLLPQAREFKLVLPVPGSHTTEITGYLKSNGECFARLVTNNAAASKNIFQLHQLQNLFYSITGTEMEVKR